MDNQKLLPVGLTDFQLGCFNAAIKRSGKKPRFYGISLEVAGIPAKKRKGKICFPIWGIPHIPVALPMIIAHDRAVLTAAEKIEIEKEKLKETIIFGHPLKYSIGVDVGHLDQAVTTYYKKISKLRVPKPAKWKNYLMTQKTDVVIDEFFKWQRRDIQDIMDDINKFIADQFKADCQDPLGFLYSATNKDYNERLKAIVSKKTRRSHL